MSAAIRLYRTVRSPRDCAYILKRCYAPRISTSDKDIQIDRVPSRLKKRLAKQGLQPEDIFPEGSGSTSAERIQSKNRDAFGRKPVSESAHFPLSEDELKKLVQEMSETELASDVSVGVETPEEKFPSDMKKYNNWRRDQSRKAFRPKVDPQKTTLILFPGQGSQFVGMGKNLLDYKNVKELYEEASEILKYDLLQLCLSGPMSSLSSTVHCQPAVMVTSLAAVQKLQAQDPEAIEACVGTAGLSIGEFAALVFAGVMDFADAVRVVQVRAEAMQRASEEVSSGMISVFLGREAKLKTAMLAAREYCQQRCDIREPVCTVANYLYPECKVVAGNTAALEFIEKNAKSFGIRRTKRLAVSGAFHTSLMASAKQPCKDAFSKVTLSKPEIPVYSNVTASMYKQPKKVTELLTEQLTAPVKWEQIMHVLYSREQGENFPRTFEMGPGSQLGAMLKLTNVKAYQRYKNIEV